MSSNSRRYLQLKNRVQKLEDAYLPNINTSGRYSQKQTDDIRAYLLLSHAEIESYLEDILEEKVKKAHSKWRSNRKQSNVLLALASFHDGKISERTLEDKINKIVQSFINKLRKNHGIKEENINNMLLPIGLDSSDLDATWLNTMNSFGSNRGDVAHRSVRVQNLLDPVTLKNDIHNILQGIKDLDIKLKQLN